MAEIEKNSRPLPQQKRWTWTCLAAEVKRATELIAGCKSRLRKAEEEVSKILES